MASTKRILPIVLLVFFAVVIAAMLKPARLLNLLASDRHYKLTSGIVYAPLEHLQLDVYQPSRAHAAASPVIVFFYGGSWNSGSRLDYQFVAAALTARGFVVVVPDYRLYPQVRYPLFLQDCAEAVAWTLRSIDQYGGDLRRVYLLGHSAGAYNAAMLALDSRWLHGAGVAPDSLKAWAGLAGPYHFLPSTNPQVQPVFMHPHYPAQAQPIEHVRAARLPAFIAAARNDDLVDPQQNSAQLARQMERRGIPTALKLYASVNHLTLIGAFAWPLQWLAPVLDDTSDYFLAIE